MSRVLPAEEVGGIVVVDMLAIVAILTVCFAVGLFVGTGLGRALRSRLEHFILRRVPGYTFAKSGA